MGLLAFALGIVAAFIVHITTDSGAYTDDFTLFLFLLHSIQFVWPPLLFAFSEALATTYFKRSLFHGLMFSVSFALLLIIFAATEQPSLAALLFVGNSAGVLQILMGPPGIFTLFLVVYLPTSLAVVIVRGKDHDRSGWYCLKCGYDTTHIIDEAALIRCPECGIPTGSDKRLCARYVRLFYFLNACLSRKSAWALIALIVIYAVYSLAEAYIESRPLQKIISLTKSPEVLVRTTDEVISLTSEVASERFRSNYGITHWEISVMTHNDLYLLSMEPVTLRNRFFEPGWPLVQFQSEDTRILARFFESEPEMEVAVILALEERDWVAKVHWDPNANYDYEIIKLSELFDDTE